VAGGLPGRGVAIPCRLAFISQLTSAVPRRKQPETANIITLADRRSARSSNHGSRLHRAPVLV